MKGDKLYHEEGKKIIKEEEKKENVKQHSQGPDAIWTHPETGAKVFVGDYKNASNLKELKSNEIFHIINCQESSSENYH